MSGHVQPHRHNVLMNSKHTSGLIVVGVCVLLSACQGPPTVWTAEVRSPDGLWLASARTVQNGGFGSANIDTSVYLKRTNVSESPMQFLYLMASETLGLEVSKPAII